MQVGPGPRNHTLTVRTLNVGLTLLAVWDSGDMGVADFVALPVEHAIQPPDAHRLVVGDVVCFGAQLTSQEGESSAASGPPLSSGASYSHRFLMSLTSGDASIHLQSVTGLMLLLARKMHFFGPRRLGRVWQSAGGLLKRTLSLPLQAPRARGAPRRAPCSRWIPKVAQPSPETPGQRLCTTRYLVS